MIGIAVGGFLALLVVYVLFSTVRVVGQQTALIIERLGRFDRAVFGGLQILVPFVDSVRATLDLRESAVTIAEQDCITKDNVMVHVDGILYYKIIDAERATYGISNMKFAIEQLAQTTLRSEIGKIELDHTFEERSHINVRIVEEIDKASEAWGVKVLRYEIKTIRPSADILDAMEKQMRAEREKRAVMLQSEGERSAAINQSEGVRESLINRAEGEKQQLIKEAEGKARGDSRGGDRNSRGNSRGGRSDSRAGRFRGSAVPRRQRLHSAVRKSRQRDQYPHPAGEYVRYSRRSRDRDERHPARRWQQWRERCEFGRCTRDEARYADKPAAVVIGARRWA